MTRQELIEAIIIEKLLGKKRTPTLGWTHRKNTKRWNDLDLRNMKPSSREVTWGDEDPFQVDWHEYVRNNRKNMGKTPNNLVRAYTKHYPEIPPSPFGFPGREAYSKPVYPANKTWEKDK